MIGESWQIGDVTITRIAEMLLTADSGIMDRLIPDATAQQLLDLPWLQPHFVDPQGRMSGSIHTLVVRTPTQLVVVDTCVGNDKERKNEDFHKLQSNFLNDFHTAGFKEEEVDTVLCTHLHIDHVGWNTILRDGEWHPTFANAHYLFGEVEFNNWHREDHGARGAIASIVSPCANTRQLGELLQAVDSACPCPSRSAWCL